MGLSVVSEDREAPALRDRDRRQSLPLLKQRPPRRSGADVLGVTPDRWWSPARGSPWLTSDGAGLGSEPPFLGSLPSETELEDQFGTWPTFPEQVTSSLGPC